MRRLSKRIGLALALCLTTQLAQAAEAQIEVRYALEISGDASVHTLVVPPQIYAESRLDGLNDLVIRNGAGEKVPFTFEAPKPASAEDRVQTRELRWFEVPSPGTVEARPEIGLTIRSDGTLAATAVAAAPGQPQRIDVIDLGNTSDWFRALQFDLAPAPYQGRVRVDISSDLQDWHWVGEATLTRLGDGDAVIAQSRVSLSTSGRRYLRLRWLDPAPVILRLSVTYTTPAPEPGRDWILGLPARAVADGVYEFDAGSRAPVDRIVVHPPQINTVATVRLSSRPDASVPWRFAGVGSVVAMSPSAGGAAVKPLETAPTGDRLWRIQVAMQSYGFGTGAPTVDLGWRPATATFLARGSGPFELAVGGGESSNAMPRAALLPPGDVAIGVARLGARLDAKARPNAAVEGGEASRRALLWATLIAAVVFLGFMAWRMLKDPPPPTDTTAPPV